MADVSKLLKKITHACDQKKATRIVSYHVEGISALTDYILVVSVNNKVHCHAILREVEDVVSKEKKTADFYKPRVSGDTDSGWIVMDINSIIVHVMTEDMREFYNLDALLEKRAVVYHY